MMLQRIERKKNVAIPDNQKKNTNNKKVREPKHFIEITSRFYFSFI